MGTTTSYVPYDYRRVCDLCGNLYNRSRLSKQGRYMYCDAHKGERINEQLDRANARQKPFRILPVPNAKPEDPIAPDVFEAEESTIFSLLDFVRAGGARYAQVESGEAAPLPNAADVIPTNGWACWHYYGLAIATYPKGHVNVWQAQALAHLRTAADTVLALQTLMGTRATNAFYGGLLATGASKYYAEDAAVGGIAFLYAYRALGDLKYLWAARNAASFLRNLQAIGKYGTNFTSSDAAGTARLYTGGITSLVSTTAGFYSDHCFYPSSLLALWFWNELRLTDGDQSLGATTAATGFDTAPAQLLAACMADLRSFWATGTYDVTTLDVRTGFSATTPSEFFNAYPQVKPNTDVNGTGSWEYEDGFASNGTTITGLNFAKALASLYAIDGLTDQVTAIDNWLQTFTSNPSFETPAVSSAQTLQHATTGTYDPTLGIAQLLLVRDPTTFAPTAKNGGSLYDWGAFGLVSPIWSRRRGQSLKNGRYQAALERQRFRDGLASDSYWDDRGFLRGRQGLSYQTGFREVLAHGPLALTREATAITTPPSDDMLFWFKSDRGVTMDPDGYVTAWADQGPHHWDLTTVWTGIDRALFTENVANGLPALLFPPQAPAGTMDYIDPRGGSATPRLPTEAGAPRIVLAMVKQHATAPTNGPGGLIVAFRRSGEDLEFGMWTNGGRQMPFNNEGPWAQKVTIENYEDVVNVIDWTWYGQTATPPLLVHVNDVEKPYTVPIEILRDDTGNNGFSVGGVASFGGNRNYAGFIFEVLVYGSVNPATRQRAADYLQFRAGQLSAAIVYDGVAAAQYGFSLRQAPRA